MIERRSAEEWLTELEDTGAGITLVSRCQRTRQAHTRGSAGAYSQLGFTAGEALRLLRPKERS